MNAVASPAGGGADTRRQMALRSAGFRTSHTLGTEPLWKYCAEAHTPYSGGARYPPGFTASKQAPGWSFSPYAHQDHLSISCVLFVSELKRAGSVSIVFIGTTYAAMPSS